MEFIFGVLIGIPLGVGLTIVWALCRISAAQEKLDWEGRGGGAAMRFETRSEDDMEWLAAEVKRLRGEVSELLAGRDADALIITQAGKDQVRMRRALAKLVSVLEQGAYIVYGGDGYTHCVDCYVREGQAHEADCIYLTVLPDLMYLGEGGTENE